jgi:filamentous hemagglutinin family protein
MNKFHRVIWSSARQAFIVVSELAPARGKPSRTSAGTGIAALAVGALVAGMPPAVMAQTAPGATQLPTGGHVVAGDAQIRQGNAMLDINQSSQRAAIDWQTFNVGREATVNFNQPSVDSVALNRVADFNASQIFGRINANGQVFLSNPNGVYFAPGASVDVGGLVATTHTISLEDFMGGHARFERNGARGSVINDGELRAALGGYVALLAPEVRNQGLVLASTAALAAGERIELRFDENNTLAGLSVTPSTIEALVENRSAVLAPGGLIILSARAVDAVRASVINSGEVSASSLVSRGGRLLLEGNDIELRSGSSLTATGATRGGEVLVGGDWQGSGPLHQATRVTLQSGARVDVSATVEGDGGKAVLWSDVHDADSHTLVHGTIRARGAGRGAGGSIETSGHSVRTDGAMIDAGAEAGPGGLWLLDPYDYLIDGAAATTISNSLSAGTSVTIDTANNTGAGAGASGSGDITVAAAIAKTGGVDATLTLKADRHILLQSGATFSSNTGKLNLLLWGDSDNSGDGIIQNASTSIVTNGGWLKFGNNQSATINGSLVSVGGDVFFNGTAAQAIHTAGGAVDIFGEAIIGNPLGLTINTAGGNVGLHGVVNSGNRYTWVDQTGDTAHDWSWARNAAINGTGGRSAIGDSYLVTINSRLENSIAGLTAGYRGAWIGAWRANPATSYAWTWADGPEAGAQFFTQAGSGGTAMPGYYSNFGAGEPNGALNAGGENVGQFFGTSGQWNDLGITTQFSPTQSGIYNVLGYVRETNTANSPLVINAGGGSVTFDSAVGGSKSLASLDVTSGLTSMNGSSITTQGMQAYRGPVQLGVNTTLTTRNSDILFGSTVDSANPAMPRTLNLNILPETTYYWVDWTSSTPTSVSGTITIGSDVINVTYANQNGYSFAQTSSGTNFWTYSGGSSPYVSNNVANGPTGVDMVALNHAGSQTLTFSQSVENLAFGVISLNGNGYGFDQDFNIESYSGYNGAGSGYWGTGSLSRNVVGNAYQLLGPSGEPHGMIRFTGAFSTLTWQSLSNENWNGFTVGVSGASANAGVARFEGIAGATGALGAVTVNGAMRTTAEISNAASLSVSGAASLGGNITTSGNQSFSSAVTLTSAAALSTTSNGNVGFTSTVNGGHALTVSTNGTGDASFNGAVGGTTALAGLAVNTDVLSAGAIRLAASAVLGVNNSGSSAITGVISGSNASLAKSGSGTLTLSGANTYSGGSTISGGVVKLGAATTGTITSGPLGTGSVAVAGGGALDLSGYSLRNALSLAGTGVGGNGALYNSTGTAVTVFGNTTLTADASVKSESGGTLNLNGTVNGAHVLTIDTDGPSLDAAVNITGIIGGVTPLGGLNIDSGSANTTVAAAVSTVGAVSLQGASLSLNAPMTASGANVSLQATGTITDGASGYVNAAGLRLLGGNVTLDHNSNNVDTLAASGVGALTFVDASGLTLGSLAGTNGVTATGAIHIGTRTGDLTIAQNVSTSNATASALVLNAGSTANAGTTAGGNLLLSGSPVVAVGSGGTARLYTGSVSGSTGLTTLVGSGSGRFRYNSDESATNYSQVLATGLNAIYREQPTVTFGVNNQTVGYATAFTPTLSVDSTNGDTAAQILSSTPGVVVGGSISSSGHYIAGTHAMTLSGGTDQLGYAIGSHGSGTLTVTPKALTYAGTAANRVYDGTTAATVTDNWSGSVTGDDVSVSSTGAQFSVDGNAGTGKTVTVNGVGLSGADMGNYSIGSTATTTADITRRAVSLSGTRVYDGTNVLGAGAVSLVTGVGSETLRYTGATALDAHVATSGNHLIAITLQDAADGSGGLAANYMLPTLDAAHAPVTITPALLTPTLINPGVTRVYDGTTAAPAGFVTTWSVAGLVSGDIAATLASAGAAYNSSHVSEATHVTASGLSISGVSGSHGSQASDYALSATSANVAAAITPRAVTVSGLSASDKVYDGNANVSINNWGSVSTGIGGQTLALTASGAAFTNVNAGANRTVTATGYALADGTGGGRASDYQLSSTSASTTASITPRVVSLSGSTKVYDGTTAIGAGAVAITTGIGGETLRYSGATALDAHVATSGNHLATITLQDAVDGSGGLAANYMLPTLNATNAPVTITPRALTVSGLSASDKVYDGTANVSITNWGSVSTGIGSQTLALTATGAAFTNVNAGANRTVTATGYALADGTGGGRASDYQLSSTSASTTASITPAQLVVSGIQAGNKVYDGSTGASVSTGSAVFNGLVSGDDIGFAAVSGEFSDKNVGEGKTVTLTSSYTGADIGNYTITDQATTTAAITRRNAVTWVGGATGNWFDPENWAGGAVPDLANVANVVIPAGVVVNFDTDGAIAPAQTGPVQIDSLGNAGGLSQTNGELVVGSGGVALDTFVQTGGALGTVGGFTVNHNYSQGENGTVTVDGHAVINDTRGGAQLGNLQVGGTLRVNSSDGDIAQVPGSRISVGGAAVLRAPGAQIRIDGASNDFAGGLGFGENLPVIVPPAVPVQPATASTATGLAFAGPADAAASFLPDSDRSLAASSASTRVSLVREPATTQEGLVTVEIAPDGIAAGFTFVLPRRVLGAAPKGTVRTATREDGGPLPAWLSFESATGEFTGMPAPVGALPIRVFVESGGHRWLLLVSKLEE